MRRYEDLFDTRMFNFLARIFRNDHAPAHNDEARLRSSELTEFARFIFARIADRHPLMVVYLSLPVYGANRQAIPQDVSAKEIFSNAARQAGIDFVDTGSAFAKDYAETGEPADGFYFSQPGIGHLNSEGHAVVARAISAAMTSTGFPNAR